MALTREQNRLLQETHDQPRLPVKPWNMQSAIDQIQKCRFECDGGPLENNDAWRWIVMTYGVAEPRTAPYPFCRTPEKCAGKGYCPDDPACNG